MLAAMESGRTGRRYILCSANLDYREMFAIIAAEAGVRVSARRIPDPALRTLGRVVDAWGGLRPHSQLAAGFGRATADLALRRLYYDGGRARRELGVPDGDVRAAIREMLTGPVGGEAIRDRAA
jgi:dihydroflavonol-4-reductase